MMGRRAPGAMADVPPTLWPVSDRATQRGIWPDYGVHFPTSGAVWRPARAGALGSYAESPFDGRKANVGRPFQAADRLKTQQTLQMK